MKRILILAWDVVCVLEFICRGKQTLKKRT